MSSERLQPSPSHASSRAIVASDPRSGRDLAWRATGTIVVTIAGVLFLALGLRTYLLPGSAAAWYGLPTASPEALAFVKAYGARNIAISLTALGLIALDIRSGLSLILVSAALVALLDASIVVGALGLAGAAKHLVYAVVLSGLAIGVHQGRSRRRDGI